jgi:hypothetical protein
MDDKRMVTNKFHHLWVPKLDYTFVHYSEIESSWMKSKHKSRGKLQT